MTTAVIGATGRVGRLVVRQLLAQERQVVAVVRDTAKARELFGAADGGLRIRQAALDSPAEVKAALDGAGTVFLAMGSVGLEGNLQRAVINAAATLPSVEQLVRLSVFNASPASLGINQRAHWNIDFAAEGVGVPYTTIRPAIWSASLLAAAAEVRQSRTWTGLADTGQVALSDHRDAADLAVRVLIDSSLWGSHYDTTGPRLFSWPEALGVLSGELGEKVTFVTASERDLIGKLTSQGVPAGQAELLIAREWALLAGENERVTTTFADVTGRPPRTVEDFLHENREIFAKR
jgi:NAD(P)H dehydrogenase (quinone)